MARSRDPLLPLQHLTPPHSSSCDTFLRVVQIINTLFLNMSDTNVSHENCPTSAPFFGFMGVTAALCFASKWILPNVSSVILF